MLRLPRVQSSQQNFSESSQKKLKAQQQNFHFQQLFTDLEKVMVILLIVLLSLCTMHDSTGSMHS